MPQDIDWTRALLIGVVVLAVFNAILFIALLGWGAVAVMAIAALSLVCLVLGRLLLRSFDMMIAVEDAVEESLYETDRLSSQFEELVSELPWMEDVPQTRKMAKVLYEVKYGLMSIPSKYNRNLGLGIGDDSDSELQPFIADPTPDVIAPDDDFIERLKAGIAERADEAPSNNARPIQ